MFIGSLNGNHKEHHYFGADGGGAFFDNPHHLGQIKVPLWTSWWERPRQQVTSGAVGSLQSDSCLTGCLADLVGSTMRNDGIASLCVVQAGELPTRSLSCPMREWTHHSYILRGTLWCLILGPHLKIRKGVGTFTQGFCSPHCRRREPARQTGRIVVSSMLLRGRRVPWRHWTSYLHGLVFDFQKLWELATNKHNTQATSRTGSYFAWYGMCVCAFVGGLGGGNKQQMHCILRSKAAEGRVPSPRPPIGCIESKRRAAIARILQPQGSRQAGYRLPTGRTLEAFCAAFLVEGLRLRAFFFFVRAWSFFGDDTIPHFLSS